MAPGTEGTAKAARKVSATGKKTKTSGRGGGEPEPHVSKTKRGTRFGVWDPPSGTKEVWGDEKKKGQGRGP